MIHENSPSYPSCDLQGLIHGLGGRCVIVEEVDELVDQLAREIHRFAHQRLREAGVFHLALSGGSTPQALYQRLITDPAYRLLPWSDTHLWIVDDRCVPLEDERSNFRMIRDLIVNHVNMPASHVHPMPVMEPGGDERYERDLRASLSPPSVENRLDYVLLGMGNDAHTASLFPQTPALGETRRWVLLNDGPTVASPRPRMTMTYPLINAARRIAVLVTGSGKHATLLKVAAKGPRDPRHLPVAAVAPIHKDTELTWYLDQAAATGINP